MRRLALIAVFASLAAACTSRSGNPSTGASAPANQPSAQASARTLDLLATGKVGGHFGVQVSGGLVFTASTHPAGVVAFPRTCGTGGDTCEPAWVADPGTIEASRGFAAAGGMVYVATDDLYAYSAFCGRGGAMYEPAWVGRVLGRPSEPVIGAHAVYVTSHRKLYSFPTACGSDGGACEPNWVSVQVPHRGSMGLRHPELVGDAVYLQSCCYPAATKYVAFPTHCGSAAATCRPLEDAPAPPPQPLKSDGETFALRGQRHPPYAIHLRALPGSCSEPPCKGQALWTGDVGSSRAGLMASGEGLVFVHQQFGGSAAGPNDAGILAFPTDCGTGEASCEPMWTWGTGDGDGARVAVNDLATAGERLYAAGGDGKLYVFALPAA